MLIRQVVPVIVVALIIVVLTLLGLYGDLLWFSSVGYESVFVDILLTSVLIGLASFAVFTAISVTSIHLASRAAKMKGKKGTSAKPLMLLAAVIGLVVGVGMSGSWEVVLKFFNSAAFGVADPIFGSDVGFYAFSLPFYSLVINFLLGTFIASAVLAVASFGLSSLGVKTQKVMEEPSRTEFFFQSAQASRTTYSWKGDWERIVPVLSVLLFLIFAVSSASIWIAQYGVLFSTSGAVYGAGFTDVNVMLPLLNVLSFVSFVIGLLFLLNIRMKKTRFIRDGILAFVIIAVIGMAISGIVQGLIVGPDEFSLEKKYIERNIQGTLSAYGLGGIDEKMFEMSYDLESSDIQSNNATINNIRLWDWRPLRQTYEQLQLFRTYYTFNDVDIDRYDIDGNYKEVMVSAREIEADDLPSQAQTWVNRHLVYTHGYGIVMNPVDQVTGEGLPVFYVKDIPPTSEHFTLEQPRIYFGERTDDFVIVGTTTEELDYPSGDDNVKTIYSGTGGVVLDDLAKRLAYAVKFGSVEILVSGAIQPDSRILMNRQIEERVNAIAPFLAYDNDPYIVNSNGRLYWILDAYTITDQYPYSEPVWIKGIGNLNYIRNSVKVVIDAYNGDVSFYAIDPTDPLLQAYSSMFPGMFNSFDEMPSELKDHVRYPEGLFNIQAHIYSTYHMKNPAVFYNKEDAWVIPDEIYRGSRQQMQPYYVIMNLPEGDGEGSGPREEFILMIPFTPKGKENLIGWMAARSDPPNYGNSVVYGFSKQELTFGPMQIEARIDQDPEISQLITLWSQSGSSVLRGNTLVIPIDGSILYVEPLYLEATGGGTLPQLQRVIVAYGDQLTMQKTLGEAIDVIFGRGTALKPDTTGEPGKPDQPPSTTMEKLARIAELYDNAQEALAEGNLGLYQENIDEIGKVL